MSSEVGLIKEKYNKRWKRRRMAGMIFILASISIALILIFVLYSPIFNIKEIEVRGQNRLDKEHIIKISNIQIGQNIFKIRLSKVGSEIEKEPYIKNASRIKRIFPSKILIEINERTPIGAVSCMGSYIIIDKEGMALETVSEIEDKRIVEIKGIKLDNFVLGKPILEEDSEKLEVALGILAMLNDKSLLLEDLLLKSDYIDVSNMNKIIMYTDKRFDVTLGSSAELKSKVTCKDRLEFLRDLMNKDLQGQKGYIDLTEDKLRFRPRREGEQIN